MVMKPYTVYLVINLLTSSSICQSFYPEFLTEREALALLASEDQSPVSTSSPPTEGKTSATSDGGSGDSGPPPGSHQELGVPQDPGQPSKNPYDFSSHHYMMDPVNHKKFYDHTGTSMDHMKQQEEKAANEPTTHHHVDHHHKHHHSEEKKNTEHKHHDHQHQHHDHQHQHHDHKHHDHQHHHSHTDHKEGEHHKHHKDEKSHEQHHHQDQDQEKKKDGNYYRRPQYDEVIDPHPILLEPHPHPLPHIDPEGHNMYYKAGAYDYGTGGGEVAYRSDFYWLIPLVIVIGIGALLLPLLSLFMTIMVSQGAISLTGRRKRSFSDEIPALSSESILNLISRLESAISKSAHKFNSQKI